MAAIEALIIREECSRWLPVFSVCRPASCSGGFLIIAMMVAADFMRGSKGYPFFEERRREGADLDVGWRWMVDDGVWNTE